MWTETHLVEDLQRIGLAEGANVLVHASLRAVGGIEGGAETLVNAFRQVLGPSGTLLVPTFCDDHNDPAGWQNPPATSEDRERMRLLVPAYDPDAPASSARCAGVFAEIVRQQPDAMSSGHPALAFAAIGANAAFVTQNAPFHYPLGSGSPPARLHQLDGYVLLMGVPHTANSSIHLAEVWAEAPYTHRSRALKLKLDLSLSDGTDKERRESADGWQKEASKEGRKEERKEGQTEWKTMKGSPECSAGFTKIEPLLQNCRVLRRDYIGNAPSQLMRQRAVVSMAIALLQGEGSALLCKDPDCAPCALARKFTAEQIR